MPNRRGSGRRKSGGTGSRRRKGPRMSAPRPRGKQSAGVGSAKKRRRY